MTKKLKLTAVLSLVKYSLFALLISALYGFWLTRPVSSPPGQTYPFEVARGESVQTIAAHLVEAKLLRSPLYFRFLIRQQQLTLQAGIYQLSSSLTPLGLARAMTKGLSLDKKLTFPEGYRLEQIAETAGLPLKDFRLAVGDLEGQLFPDTYFVKDNITSTQLVETMHNTFLKKIGTVDKQTLILASLVERETRGDAEKPVVAGILKKRLEAGWPLELDATVQYFLGKSGSWWPNTTLLDRKLKSPYNTYLHTGLPPAPICNPGLPSIQAAQNPVASTAWFYLHDKNGTIHYGATLDEHNQNIAKYIK